MAVGREGARLDQDRAAFMIRAIEARQQQMQIHAQGVHGHDFQRPRASQSRELGLQLFGVADPGRSGLLVPQSRVTLPVLDLGLDHRARSDRGWPQ
jgi:hypothetical protein